MNDSSGMTLHCCVIEPPQNNSSPKNIHPISTLTNKQLESGKNSAGRYDYVEQ
jgi:hypothetical protein